MAKNMKSELVNILVTKVYRIIKFGKCNSDIEYRIKALAKLIDKIQPDIIHTLEMQHSAYLVMLVKPIVKVKFPVWLLTPWGSDIYLFGRIDEHKCKIRNVLKYIDGYIPQSKRDVTLAKKINPQINILPQIMTNSGYKMEEYKDKRSILRPSDRKCILLKGYQGWAGRALCALKGMRYIVKELRDYTIYIYLPSPEVELYSKLLVADTNINLKIVQYTSQSRILELQSRARISLGLSISDGIPNSLLEAMLMGSFPIESIQGCGEELIRHKENGMLVDPEEPSEIAKAIIYAIEEDEIVDAASIINWTLIEKHAEYTSIKTLAKSVYRKAVRNYGD